MAIVDLVMPKLGESIMEATVLKWHKQPGDSVKMDETVLDIATDKVDSEVPSTAEGVIAEILFTVNDVVPIGTVIARIKTGAAETVTPTITPAQPKTEVHHPQVETVAEVVSTQHTTYKPAYTEISSSRPQTSNGNGAGRFYSPLVLNIAGSEGVSLSELEHIPGTGNEGRVTKKDILQYVSDRKKGNRNRDSFSREQTWEAPNRQESSALTTTQRSQSESYPLTTYSG